jgi:hypothetical protein
MKHLRSIVSSPAQRPSVTRLILAIMVTINLLASAFLATAVYALPSPRDGFESGMVNRNQSAHLSAPNKRITENGVTTGGTKPSTNWAGPVYNSNAVSSSPLSKFVDIDAFCVVRAPSGPSPAPSQYPPLPRLPRAPPVPNTLPPLGWASTAPPARLRSSRPALTSLSRMGVLATMV